MSLNCGVYQITNTTTGDYYVGSSSNIQKRWNRHKRELREGAHANIILRRAWNKYGEDAFVFETILLCDVENKLYFEQVLLDNLKPVYNIAKDAMAPMQGLLVSEETRRKIGEARLGHVVTEETRLKISEAQIGNTNGLGYKHTDEARAKMSEAMKGNTSCLGRTQTEEHKRKNSEAQKGKHMSEESRVKMSEAHKGRCLSEETRAKLSAARKGELNPSFGKPMSEENKRKLIEANLGKRHSEETKAKMSVAQLARREAERSLEAATMESVAV